MNGTVEEHEQTGKAALAFLTFRAGGERFGVPIEAVREAARLRSIAPLPGAPAGLVGVALVRGEPLGVVDVGVSFGTIRDISEAPDTEVAMLVVLAGRPFALLVEHVDGVQGILPERITPPPSGSRGLTGVVPEGQKSLGLLDLDAITFSR